MSGRKPDLDPPEDYDSLLEPTGVWSGEGIQRQLAEQERDSMLQTAVQARRALWQFCAILKELGVEEETLDHAKGLLADKLAAEDD